MGDTVVQWLPLSSLGAMVAGSIPSRGLSETFLGGLQVFALLPTGFSKSLVKHCGPLRPAKS